MASGVITLAVFISGGGSNLQALIDACANDAFPAKIGLVVSNIPDAYGLERAAQAGIPTAVVPHGDYDSRDSFEGALLKTLTPHHIDAICLAGFMRILTPHFIEGFGKPMLNIHPSLLPAYKGLNTHARALADGAQEAGCTVHHVVPDVDSGEILIQKRVPVLKGDTPDRLAARILDQEHLAYPEAVEALAKQMLG